MKQKKKQASLAKQKEIENRRQYPRKKLKKVWVTEHCGDFMYLSQALDISLGGVFLEKRMRTSFEPSRLSIHSENGSMTIEAQQLYDRLAEKSYGTGYCFLAMNKDKTNELKGFLKSLK